MKTVKTSLLPLIAAVIASTAASTAIAQGSPNTLAVGTTLPIQFEHGIDSNHTHTGETIAARLSQLVLLGNGQTLPAGSRVTGHVVDVRGFAFDKTPYAKQAPSSLAIQFDSIEVKGESIPLHVSLRAMAAPMAVWDTHAPLASDMDSLGTTTQIGGDRVVPSQNEVTSQDGDVVGYQRRGGIYAHLVSASGNGSSGCDGTDTEQAVGPFSASACGLYGYTGVTTLGARGDGTNATVTLVSQRRAAKIWAKSAALLEVSR
jgi:hypothetical protein